MKNLLLILLLANILYFLWGWLSPAEKESGVAVLDESELGPPLTMAQKQRGGDHASGYGKRLVDRNGLPAHPRPGGRLAVAEPVGPQHAGVGGLDDAAIAHGDGDVVAGTSAPEARGVRLDAKAGLGSDRRGRHGRTLSLAKPGLTL